ncbi:MAG TPA: sigma-70 family RNA polymerase sigma factor [Chthonomonadales bacterium]|nr:sigma-70 family RNA polymerase sigma factor [Chthonomonadales bacterium]
MRLFGQREKHTDATKRAEFDGLFARSYGRAYKLAYWMLGDAAEAEDVAQDAFVRAWRHFDRYDRSRSFDTWLGRIAANLCIDRIRRIRRAPTCSLDAPIPTESGDSVVRFDPADEGADPSDRVLKRVVDERLHRALQKLPAEYRAAVLLSAVEDLSYQEIAESLRCPIGTVRSRIHRGRVMLRQALEADPSWRLAPVPGALPAPA